jgi:catechol 2,3-dioxygenase-like lactoylglutathione lyase family enzyme
MGRDAPRVEHVLETSLHVEELERARRFYQEVLGLEEMVATERFSALDAHGGSVLLLFERGAAASGTQTAGGWIPPHDAEGRSHVAFAVTDQAALDHWVARLGDLGIPVESRVTWPSGAASVYFRDPDGHSVELASPGIWPLR